LPDGLATMHSQVRVRDATTHKTHVETVALPAHADVLAGRRPLHSWPGPLLLGTREGDEIEWCYGGILMRWRIEEILFRPTTTSRSEDRGGKRVQPASRLSALRKVHDEPAVQAS
jgi:hypothetical protein